MKILMRTITQFFFAAALLSGNLAHAQPTARSIEMNVDGLVCAFCAQGIDKKFRKLDATADVFVSLEHHLVAVELKPGQDIADAELAKLLTEAGYTLRSSKRIDEALSGVRARTEKP